MRPYISYDRTSVQLHVKKAGEAETVYDYTKLTISWANGNDDYQENWTDTNSNPTRFKVSKLNGSPITIYPGDSYYVTYKITVKPEVYAAMQSDKVTITNRYLAYVDNEKGGQEINRVWQQLELNEYSWVQKKQPKVTNQSETISMENQEGTADIGQKVNFKTTITAKKGAENYVLHDTMSDGLTFDANSVNVKLKKKNDGSEETLKAAQYALVKPGTETEGTKCTFEVKFEKALCDTLENDDQLIVTYSATLNDKAEIGNTGNKNETKLTYGDNNKTETATTTTRTFEIPVFKYTLKDNKETALKDATFTLSKDSVTTPNTKEIIKLRKKNGTAEEEYLVDSNGEEQVTTTATGKFKIQGLDAGTYYLTETQQPAGYNKLKAPITIKIDDEGKIYVNEVEEVNVGDVKVLNNTGSLLPSTGGMGTALFYIFGAILVIGSGVVLITKKRMK